LSFRTGLESPVRNLLFVDATLRKVGFHEPVPLGMLEAPRAGRARLQSCRHSDKTHTAFGRLRFNVVPKITKNLVIPNRAGSPVKNLLFADATTSRRCPIFRALLRKSLPNQEDWGGANY
jgi:hypothetical protein